jgi:hypothetical protein
VEVCAVVGAVTSASVPDTIPPHACVEIVQELEERPAEGDIVAPKEPSRGEQCEVLRTSP